MSIDQSNNVVPTPDTTPASSTSTAVSTPKEARNETGNKEARKEDRQGSFLEVLLVFTRLGLTSFGGPIAHLGYFRAEIVNRRKWVSEQTYADLVALCQFLPGPASSEVGMALGFSRAGLWGGLAAWLGFTWPSALALVLFAYGLNAFGAAGSNLATSGWLHGLTVVAVAVVAQAVWGMARNFSNDRARATLTILAAVVTLLWPFGWMQLLVIAGAGLLGWRFLDSTTRSPATEKEQLPVAIPRPLAVTCLVVFGLLLLGLPLLRQASQFPAISVFDSFYRSGALVFGGGHVVLPLLQAEVVPPGWVSQSQFLTGYGAAQAVPGPLFTFAAYLGAVNQFSPNGWLGGLIALLGIFLPAFLLVVGTLPFWNIIRARPAFQAVLTGVNAAVVGLLLAALYDPAWTNAIRTPGDFALGLAAFGLLVAWKWPPWLVVLLAAGGGFLLGFS